MALSDTWDAVDPGGAPLDVVVEALAAQPLAARRLAGGAPARLPLLSVRGTVLEELFDSLDLVAGQLCYLAKLKGGLTLEAARVEAPELDVAVLQRAARQLQVAGLAVVVEHRLVLHPDLGQLLALSQPTVHDAAPLLTNDVLERAGRLLGLAPVRRKGERLAALAGVVGDRQRLTDALRGVSPAAVDVFRRVVEATVEGRTAGYEVPGSVSLYELDAELVGGFRMHRRDHPGSPVDELCDRCLLGSVSEWRRSEVWVWAETLVALRGRLFERWAPTPMPDTQPLAEAPPAAAGVVGALRDLVAHTAANPPLGKRTGDEEPPVKYWRAAAKALRIDGGQACLLGETARSLGLLVPLLGPVQGRGRNASQEVRWHPEPGRVAELDALPLGRRWALVVDAWLHGGRREHTDARLLLLNLLCELPEGNGVGAATLAPWAADRHRLLADPAVVDEVVADLLHVGLITTGGGTVGLTAAGRALLFTPDGLEALLGAGATTFVCQPDHSIIAPASLQAAVAEQLRRIATLESHGGATVWRLDATHIAREAARTPAEQLVAFLRSHSSVPVPAAVERFIRDSARAVEPVVVQAVGCLVTGTDPAAVADAARVKAAKLTVIAPGVAASPLPPDRVSELLLGRGVVLQRIGTAPTRRSAATAGTSAPAAPAPPDEPAASALPPLDSDALAPTWMVQHRPPGSPLPEVGTIGAGLGPAQHDALAARMTGRRPRSAEGPR